MFKFQPLILALSAMVLSISCGMPDKRKRTPMPTTEWKTVATSVVKVSTLPMSLNSQATNVTYELPELSKFKIDTSGLVPNLRGNKLDLGNIKIKRLRTNNLTICGVNGNIKCNKAVIRAYTLDGFRHSINLNALPVRMDNKLIRKARSNATVLDSYDIPNNKWVLKRRHFVNLDFDVSINLGNAGYGPYEMDLILEVALGHN